ncbi:MAG: hypothetical protein ACYTBS_17190 [Planctomycetota bacterium]
MRRPHAFLLGWVASVGCAVAISNAFATAQSGDVLVVDGEEHRLQTFPLEPFLALHPDLRPNSDIISSNLWRGYIASWELTAGRLFLTDIRARRANDKSKVDCRSAVSRVFPGGAPVFAGWFTGYLVVPQGERVEYVHMGCASTFERYLVYSIVAGVQTRARDMTAKQFRRFRKAQFREYQRTEEYASDLDEAKDKNETEDEVRSFLFEVSSCRYTSIMFDRNR